MVTMSRVLGELLGAHEPMFTFGLRELESASGSPGNDVRLTSDIAAKTKQKIRELGLDPDDTTDKELYHALQGLVGLHDAFLAKAIGAKDATEVGDILPKLKKAVEKMPLNKSCWAIKHSTARKLLKQLPPKKVMKQLGYKSIDSMLKREKIDELYGALRFAESQSWMEKFIKSYKNLTPGDFEKRDIELILYDAKKWNGLAEKYVYDTRHNITHMKEMGVVAILPMPVKKMRGVAITVLPMIIYYINEIRLYSAYFKLVQVKPSFGSILVKTLLYDSQDTATMAGQPVHWRVVHHYFGENGAQHPEIFEPHVQVEDLEWRRTEDLLYKLEPALKFWDGMDYIGIKRDGAAVTFNLLDNAISYCNDLPYGSQAVYHFRDSLWNEIFVRYMGEDALREEVLGQLDYGLADINELAILTGEEL